jgi:hypothetical protein
VLGPASEFWQHAGQDLEAKILLIAQAVRGIFGDPKARIIKLSRRSKKRCAGVADACIKAGTIAEFAACATSPAATCGSFWNSKCDAFFAGLVAK